MNSDFVSIIIPTYNDWARLSTCLNALAQQTYPKENFEIIVVNNNPEDPVPAGFFTPKNCLMLTEAKAGSYAARNAGVKIAKGEIVGFTDADCIPDKNWIRNAVNYLIANPACRRIAGKMCVFFKNSTPSKAEIYDELYGFTQKVFVDTSGTSVTANLFTYKNIFDNVGYFDDTLMSGGDFIWGTIAHKNGYKIDYVEDVIVNHPARETLKELLKKEKRIGGGQAIFLKTSDNKFFQFLTFLKAIIPKISQLKFVFKNVKGSAMDKICIFFIRQYIVSIRAYERLKVEMGKKPTRA